MVLFTVSLSISPAIDTALMDKSLDRPHIILRQKVLT